MYSMTFTQKQEVKFKKYFVAQMIPIIKLMSKHNVELVLFEMSTHGGHQQLLNQWNGIFKTFIWMIQMKENLKKDIIFKTIPAMSWQQILFPQL